MNLLKPIEYKKLPIANNNREYNLKEYLSILNLYIENDKLIFPNTIKKIHTPLLKPYQISINQIIDTINNTNFTSIDIDNFLYKNILSEKEKDVLDFLTSYARKFIYDTLKKEGYHELISYVKKQAKNVKYMNFLENEQEYTEELHGIFLEEEELLNDCPYNISFQNFPCVIDFNPKEITEKQKKNITIDKVNT